VDDPRAFAVGQWFTWHYPGTVVHRCLARIEEVTAHSVRPYTCRYLHPDGRFYAGFAEEREIYPIALTEEQEARWMLAELSQ
jgi:hypothetical protein